MKAPLATSILLSLLLAATALPTHAADESKPHTPTTITSIALGADNTSYKFTPLWEKQFNNADANQLHMSMALCNGQLYIGIFYYDDIDDRKNNLFIRQFNTSTGQETNFTIKIPATGANEVVSYPIIFNDEAGNLFWARIVYNPSDEVNESLCIYKIDTEDNSNEYFKKISLHPLSEKPKKICLEEVSYVKGSLLNDTYELRVTFGDVLPDKKSKDDDANTATFLAIAKPGVCQCITIPYTTDFSYSEKRNMVLSWHPSKSDIFALHSRSSHSSRYYAPKIYRTTGNGSDLSIQELTGEISTEIMAQNAMYYYNDEYHNNFCFGLHAFEHQGNPMLVFPVINYNGKSQFQLVSWPESETMTEAKHIALLPETPFYVPDLTYHDFRQLIKSEKVMPATASRADIGEPETRLYIFSPSAGIAAYSIGSKNVGTGIENVSAGTTAFHISGHTLYVDSTADADAVIYDTQGRTVSRIAIQDGTADLSPLGKGLFIIRVGNQTAKIAL